MKKILIFAAIVAVLLLASCQKEVPVETAKEDTSTVVEPPVFTATISPGTKTTVDAASGKVSWEEGDEITITDKDKKQAVYKVQSIDEPTGKATFSYKSGATLGEGPYNATYGTTPAQVQTYSTNPGKLLMKAESQTKSLTFKVQCGLLEINLTKNGESVKSVAVTGIPTGKSATTYTLTCNNESIASQKAFYITVPAGTYYKIVITDTGDKDCTLTAASGIAVDTNHIKPVTFGSDKLVFKSNTLPGRFSVSDNKQVQFSRGNLYWDETNKKFGFEANQYDYQDKWAGTHLVSHFYWSKTDSVTYVKDYNDSGKQSSDVFFTNTNNDTANKDFTVNGVTGKYRTLSWNEWQYLFGSSEARDEKYQYPVTVCGIANCMVLAPDNFKPLSDLTKNEYSSEEWAKAEERGLVCLPPAGIRESNSLRNTDSGYYWSSTGVSNPNTEAYYMSFVSGEDKPTIINGSRSLGKCVRLVTDVQ